MIALLQVCSVYLDRRFFVLKKSIFRRKNDYLFVMDVDEGQAKFLQVEALSPSRYLCHISSLVDNKPYHSRRNVSLHETFTCISKFTGTVFLWCASRSNSNMSPKKREMTSQTSYVSHTKQDLPRLFINYRRKVLDIPEFLNKFSRFAIKQIVGKAKELQFIPAISLAGNLVPPLDNA